MKICHLSMQLTIFQQMYLHDEESAMEVDNKKIVSSLTLLKLINACNTSFESPCVVRQAHFFLQVLQFVKSKHFFL